MKTLIILRHAKSDWSDSSLNDFDRPLNKRGKKDAPIMGNYLSENNAIPDIIISSPAMRAKLTVSNICETIGYDNEIIWNNDFYPGDVETILDYIPEIPDKYNSAMIVGHNPVMEELVCLLSKEDITFPTCATAVFDIDISSWKGFCDKKTRLRLFTVPKEIK